MKKRTLLSLVAGCTLFTTAMADTLPINTAPMSTILQNLQTNGYVVVEKIKFEDKFYKAKTINVQGEKVEVRLAPETGKILEPAASSKQAISMLAAVKKVEEAGYRNIYKIESEKNSYEIKALNKDGEKVNLKFDVFSGDMNK